MVIRAFRLTEPAYRRARGPPGFLRPRTAPFNGDDEGAGQWCSSHSAGDPAGRYASLSAFLRGLGKAAHFMLQST